ncbi:deoxynucleoside kinase [Candidatus Woesearchaeota archaeon]|nr:deoxynucleoside kinase [Candidatus Woesearchaeota archaeon]
MTETTKAPRLELQGVDDNKLWVCMTGVDGCGKTTGAQYLAARLAPRSKYWKSPHYDWVRSMMALFGKDQQGKDAYSDAVTFATSHRAEQYLLRKWWVDHDALVSQRGVIDFYTFLAAEGFSRRECDTLLNWRELPMEDKPYAGRFVAPHLIVYMECETERALGRIKKEDKWEFTEFLKKLEGAYDEFFAKPPALFERTKVIRVDARPSPEIVQKRLDDIAMDIRGAYRGP